MAYRISCRITMRILETAAGAVHTIDIRSKSRHIASGAKSSHSRHMSPLSSNQIAEAFRPAEFYFLRSQNNLSRARSDSDIFGQAIASARHAALRPTIKKPNSTRRLLTLAQRELMFFFEKLAQSLLQSPPRPGNRC